MNEATIQTKVELVNEITTKVKDAKSLVVVEYRGLSVAEVTDLRRQLRAENVELVVYKNSMVRRATEAAGFNEINDVLVGPNAFAFGLDDAVAPARVLAKFAKKHKALVLKKGIVDGKILSPEEVQTISELPNKEGMYSMLLGCLQSPIRSFALAVKAIAEKE